VPSASPGAIVLGDLPTPPAPPRIAATPATPGVPFQAPIAFSPDGRTLAPAPARHTVALWDLSTPSVPHYLATVSSTGPVAALEFAPAAPQLAYLSNGAVTVVDLTDPAHQAHAPMPGITPSAGHSYALRHSPDGTGLTAVAVGHPERAPCTWTVTSLSRPLPAPCRTGHSHLDGEITFTPGGTTLVGPSNHWANMHARGQNPLVTWPTLLG